MAQPRPTAGPSYVNRRAIASGKSADAEPADPAAATLDDRLAAIGRLYDALLQNRAPQAHVDGDARFAPEAVAIPAARFIDAMLHGLPLACALLDEADRCIAHNPRFAGAAADLGIAVRSKADALVFRTPGLHARWLRGLQDVRRSGGALRLPFATMTGEPWALDLVAIRTPSTGERVVERVIAMLTRQPIGSGRRIARFADRHRLTPAESLVLRGLCEGRSIRDIADESGTAPATVRTLLARVFRKAGCHSQRALVIAALGTDNQDDGEPP